MTKVKGHSFKSKGPMAWCSCRTWSSIMVDQRRIKSSYLRSMWESHVREILWHAGVGRVPTV